MQRVLVFTSQPCGYCSAAKSLLDQVGVAYDETDLTGDPEARLALSERSGQRTVPQIFVGEVHVGGYTELRALHSAGKLLPLVNS